MLPGALFYGDVARDDLRTWPLFDQLRGMVEFDRRHVPMRRRETPISTDVRRAFTRSRRNPRQVCGVRVWRG